jgi:hypothetical protein
MAMTNDLSVRRIDTKDFTVAQIALGPEGALIFDDAPAGAVFYTPNEDGFAFHQLSTWDKANHYCFAENNVQRTIIAAANARGATFTIETQYRQSVTLTCGNDVSAYSLVSPQDTNVLQTAIRAGNIKLYGLPADHQVEYAVALPEGLIAEAGPSALIVTSPRYHRSAIYNFAAYLIPELQGRAIRLDVQKVRRHRDGGTTILKIGDNHHFLAETPLKPDASIYVDHAKVRNLTDAETSKLIKKGLIPSLPTPPTRLITPFPGAKPKGPRR